MRKTELTTSGIAISIIGGVTFIASLLALAAVVSSWIPPVMGILMELSVIVFVMAVSLVLATVVTMASMTIIGLMVGLIQDTLKEAVRNMEKAENSKKD